MSSDDGFRVGRRVIDTYGCGEGTIGEPTGDSRDSEPIYKIQFDGYKGTFLRLPSQVRLLPDEPATPEPRPIFKLTDRIRVWGRDRYDPLLVQDGHVTGLTPDGYPRVVFADGSQYTCGPSNRIDSLEPAQPTPEPQPAPERTDHYAILRERGHEPWAVIAACMTRDEAIAYHRGTALVYLMRAGLKHATPDDDICKAAAHLAEAKAIVEGKEAA